MTELENGIDRLRCASRDERQRYELTDYHRLVLCSCRRLYCDLYNDESGTGLPTTSDRARR